MLIYQIHVIKTKDNSYTVVFRILKGTDEGGKAILTERLLSNFNNTNIYQNFKYYWHYH